ncbi:hypothetical protein IP88_07695 [alpha proteobacterium AAP81b]|nr:hypothetical protein IP88_07695 [alpha proteobacterium AAP81b]
MLQTAVFVDAGYLCAQGAKALTGGPVPRLRLDIQIAPIISRLNVDVQRLAPASRLLRAYWYDGSPRGRDPSPEQRAIAQADNVKLRLGVVNSFGQQKEVDSLIITDLIELSRNRSIADAVLLSGDADLRVGVALAQSHGIRVHLIGIQPALGTLSPDLVAESDTVSEWMARDLEGLLKIRPAESNIEISGVAADTDFEAVLALVVAERVAAVPDLAALQMHFQQSRAVPPEHDRPALAELRNRIGRDLTEQEKRAFRKTFSAGVLAGSALS